MFEDGEIKNQKLSKKNLCSIPSPRMKQNHFVPPHHLDTCFQESALEKVLSKEMSLNEFKIPCQTHRALVEVRKNFMSCTNSDTWRKWRGGLVYLRGREAPDGVRETPIHQWYSACKSLRTIAKQLRPVAR